MFQKESFDIGFAQFFFCFINAQVHNEILASYFIIFSSTNPSTILPPKTPLDEHHFLPLVTWHTISATSSYKILLFFAQRESRLQTTLIGPNLWPFGQEMVKLHNFQFSRLVSLTNDTKIVKTWLG